MTQQATQPQTRWFDNRDKLVATYRTAVDVANFCSDEWQRSFDVATRRSEIVTVEPATGVATPILIVTRQISADDERLVISAPHLLRAAIQVAEAARTENRRLKLALEDKQVAEEKKAQKKDIARHCAIETGKPAFKRWLHEIHGADVADQERVDIRVRSMLKVASRAELNTDEAAAGRWRNLFGDFQSWMKS